jgi:signal transduction histidine kinase
MQHELVNELATGAPLEVIGRRLLAVIGQGMRWELGALWRVDAAAGTLEPAAIWTERDGAGTALEAQTRSLTFARGEGQPGRVWESAETLMQDDLLTDMSFVRREAASKAGMCAGIWFPVIADGSVWGVVEFFGKQPNAGDAQVGEMAMMLGRQLGRHVERVRARTELPHGSKTSRFHGSDIAGRSVAAVEDRLVEANDALERRVREGTANLHASEGRTRVASAALAASETELRALAGRLLSVREEERARLAREIHDVLGQALTGLKMDVTWVTRRLGEVMTVPAPVAERLHEMTGHLDDLIHTARRIATDLRPAVLDDLGLVAALEWQSAEYERRHGVTVNVMATASNEPQLTPEQSIAVFRVVQELLTNVGRHAGATHIDLAVASSASDVSITVTDNGCGIDEEQARGTHSLGLLGMHERLRSIGAALTFERAVGGGTKARIRLPVRHD